MEILWNTHVYNRKVLLKSLKKEKFHKQKNGSHSALNMFTEYSIQIPVIWRNILASQSRRYLPSVKKYEMSF